VSPAQIVSKGAAALVSVQVMCGPSDFTSLTLSLDEKSGNSITSGTASFVERAPCTGQIATFQVPITPAPKPFVNGTAFGQLFFQDCVPSFPCASVTDARSITLRK
jgi:hypothetical protein